MDKNKMNLKQMFKSIFNRTDKKQIESQDKSRERLEETAKKLGFKTVEEFEEYVAENERKEIEYQKDMEEYIKQQQKQRENNENEVNTTRPNQTVAKVEEKDAQKRENRNFKFEIKDEPIDVLLAREEEEMKYQMEMEQFIKRSREKYYGKTETETQTKPIQIVDKPDSDKNTVKPDIQKNEDLIARLRQIRQQENQTVLKDSEDIPKPIQTERDISSKDDEDQLNKTKSNKDNNIGKPKKHTLSRKDKKKMKKLQENGTTKFSKSKNKKEEPIIKQKTYVKIENEKKEESYKKVSVLKGKIMEKVKEGIKERKRDLIIGGAVGFCLIAIGLPIFKSINNEVTDSKRYTSENDLEFEETGLITKSFEKEDTVSEETDNKDISETSNTEENTVDEVASSTNGLTQQNITNNYNEKVEDNKKEQDKETLAENTNLSELIKVGARIKINEGKFFETPEGTGRFGRFENHTECEKLITKIGVKTQDGYISISSQDLDLADLKQIYPEAEFSYHIEDEDGQRLGWINNKSFDKIIEKGEAEIEDDIEER